jgi:HAMP domain-containing protein
MPQDQAAPAARPPRIGRKMPLRPQTMILCLLAFGLVVSLATNFQQQQRTQRLADDLTALRLKSERALADLREAQSALLEQNVRRLDDMTTQLRNATEDERQKAAISVSRMRSELRKTVEDRRQEAMTAISDLRGDLRTETNARVSQVDEIKQADRASRALASAASVDHSPAANTPIVTETKAVEEQPAPTAEKKKGFWSRMNPFSRTKKHETGSE